VYREESKDMEATIRSGRLFERSSGGVSASSTGGETQT
jgi:hypothetical protein